MLLNILTLWAANNYITKVIKEFKENLFEGVGTAVTSANISFRVSGSSYNYQVLN